MRAEKAARLEPTEAVPPRSPAGKGPLRALALASGTFLASIFLTSAALGADEIHYTLSGQTSVTFDWRGAENTIRYGPTSAYGQTVTAATPAPLPFSSAGPFWEAKVTGLQQNTLYHYAIGAGSDHTFRTPPPLGNSGFTVYVEGDIGDAGSYPNVGVVQSLITADPPAFALLVGDLTYGNAHGQAVVDRHFNDMLWSQDISYMPAWGNHEWDKSGKCSLSISTVCNQDPDCPSGETCTGAGDDLRNYKGRFDLPNPQTSPGSPAVSCCGEDWYWFDYGNVRFIAYPEPWSGAWSDWKTKAGPIMDAAQADPRITFIVTFGHRPPLSSGHHPGDATLLGYMNTLASTHGKYVLNLFGHSHDYERSAPQNGVLHITVGTGGSSIEQDGTCLWAVPCAGSCPCAAPSWSVFRAMHLGALKLRFTATAIQGQFICGPPGGGGNDVTCAPGSVVDSFTIGTPTSDTTPPTSTLSAPAPGTVVTGTVTLSASAADNIGIAGVQFKLDGNNLGAEDLAAPYSVSWNSAGVANGPHALSAAARDAAGNQAASAAVSVSVNNPPNLPPAVSLTGPAAGAAVTGTTSVSATATDDVGVVGVQFKVDGNNLGAEDTAAPYAAAWDSTLVPNGPHALTAVARDAAGASTTSASVTVTTQNAAASLITNPGLVFSVPDMAKPEYLAAVIDPTFRTTIRRIAGDVGQAASWTGPPAGSGSWGPDARQHYSKDQPWSADGTLLVLQNSGGPPQVILDGDTYQPRYGKCANYSLGDDRWHPSRQHPHERINASGAELMWFDVTTCTKTRTWTLPFPVVYFGEGEGNPSFDGRYALLGDATRMFVVDMDPQPPLAPYPSSRIGPAYTVSACGLADCSIDWVSISPSGKYALVSYNGDHPQVFDVNPTTLALTPRPMPASAPQCSGHDPARGYIFDLGHADMTLNPFDNNEDVLIGQRRGWCPSTLSGVALGGVVMVRLSDGRVTTLTDPGNEGEVHHISTRNYDRPGWAYIGYYPSAGMRFNDEIVAVKIDGSKAVERLAHKRSVFSGCYRCESHAVPSRDGRRVLWASNWAQRCGAACGTAADIKAYVVDTRSVVAVDTTPPAPPSDLHRVNP